MLRDLGFIIEKKIQSSQIFSDHPTAILTGESVWANNVKYFVH